jgi:hypothetical protein
METECEGHLPFLDIEIYRRPDGSLGHKVYRKPTHANLYLNAKSQRHPSYKQDVLSTLIQRTRALWDEGGLQAESMFLRDVFIQNEWLQQPADPQSPKQSPACRSAICWTYIQPNQKSAGPAQHQISGLAPNKIIQTPSSCQRQSRTKETRCLQDSL